MPKLLVTGASGFLGGALTAHAARAGWAVVGTFLSRPPSAAGPWRAVCLDLRDGLAVGRLVGGEDPDAIIHTAYRRDGDDAATVTTDAAARVAVAARAAGARLVHVSSDAVFGGHGGRPLTEADALDPVSPYGAAKAAAEAAVARADPGALIVRTSLLYGGRDRAPSRHETLALAAARGEADMTFSADEVRNPVQVDDLAAALLELVAAHQAGVLHVAGADAVDRHRFASLIAMSRGEDAGRLAAGPAPAGRARYCALDSSRARALLRTRLRGVHEVLAAPSACPLGMERSSSRDGSGAAR